MTTGLASRRAALEALRRVEEEGAYSTLVVPDAVADLDTAQDRAFASHLAYDTLRWEGTLDWMLGVVVDRPLGQVEPALRRILRLGALQLHRTDVPDHAVVSTAAQLAREAVPGRRAKGAAGFVNGVLRGLARTELPWPDSSDDPTTHLVLTTAHPAWIVSELVDRFGVDRAEAILTADNDPPGLTLRASGDRGELIDELRRDGIDAEPGTHAPEAVLAPGADPRRLSAVQEGRATPQDEASMLVSRSAGVAPRERILDLCAGPGGKATHLAQLGGTVTAVEINPRRAALIEEAAARLGLAVDVLVGDGTDPPVDGSFDVVLVDAPCTGLGTGRRRPEVRWRRSPADLDTLVPLQTRLLDAASALVAPGGRLVYSVCTWTAAETTGVARPLASRHPELTLGEERQLLPDVDGTDGMFIARWERSP
ncbi:MAG: transcription antitermination factor NusB [Nitriliruptorales bacterium]|nr:transcription antitermination factor NusB [Nitriliruptorales bacterium]